MNLELLEEHIASGMVRQQSHPTLPLRILNYSAECQYERKWDDVTLQCRGLVMHGDTIVARPFRKFFNESEHAEGEIPWHLPSRITEKLDGSLLIWFCFNGEWITATRGSFTSEQAKVGRQLILERYPKVDYDEAFTYLFEVIYPENRIVVNYGPARDVILLAVIETATGRECDNFGGEWMDHVRSLPIGTNPKDLRSIIRDDEEGYVVRFENGFRVKVKGERYVYLHKIISGISTRMVWEHLSSDSDFGEMLELIPDECAEWVKEQREKLAASYEVIAKAAQLAAFDVKDMSTRREQAGHILLHHRLYSSAVFAILDGKNIEPIIWKMLYPEYARPELAARIEA